MRQYRTIIALLTVLAIALAPLGAARAMQGMSPSNAGAHHSAAAMDHCPEMKASEADKESSAKKDSSYGMPYTGCNPVACADMCLAFFGPTVPTAQSMLNAEHLVHAVLSGGRPPVWASSLPYPPPKS